MQNSRENVKYCGSTRVISHRQKSHTQARIHEQVIKTLEPTFIESYADTKNGKFLNTEEKETEKTQEEIEWEAYEAGWNEGYQSGISEEIEWEIYEGGWNEGYQSGISDVKTFTHAKAKIQKKKIPQAHAR